MHTSRKVWRVREGIIITLIDNEGTVFKGEIAPIPWFGSEDINEAIQFCQQQGNTISLETIQHISDRLPACQFGFESAVLGLTKQFERSLEKQLSFCHLLPTGEKALEINYSSLQSENQPTFKWKIGVDEIATEITVLKKLISQLPQNARLRLDANGGLTSDQAKRLLEFTETQSIIEFIEQPLPPSQLSEMMELRSDYNTPLALDESVANIRQLKNCYEQGWRDVFVIKPLIAGFPSLLRQFCHKNSLDIVFSSVFETTVGRNAALQLAWELSDHKRAVGFGIDSWFVK